jgi:hypothetical protein
MSNSLETIGSNLLSRLESFSLGSFGVEDAAVATESQSSKSCPNCEPLKTPSTPFAKGAGDSVDIALNDIKQGAIGDCFLMAAQGALASANPDTIRNAIRDNGDGTYTVTLYEKSGGFLGLGQSVEKREITVNAEFPKDGKHANPTGDQVDNKAEIWPLIVEKAYAQLKGGYEAISQGGLPKDVMFALTGKEANSVKTNKLSFDDLAANLSGGQAVTASTTDLRNVPFATPGDASSGGVYGMITTKGTGTKDERHAYIVQSTYVAADGQQMVRLFNPWGSSHPSDMPFAEFQKLFTHVDISGK